MNCNFSTITLQLETYANKSGERIFFNCQTRDGFKVVLVAWQKEHYDDYKHSPGDIIKFRNVKIGKEREKRTHVNWDLHINKLSEVELLHSVLGEHTTPTQILCLKSDAPNYDNESLKSAHTHQSALSHSEEKGKFYILV